MGDAITYELDKGAISKMVNAIVKLEDFGADDSRSLYNQTHDAFNQPGNACLDLEDLGRDTLLFQRFDAMRRNDYQTMANLMGRRIVASVTTYPKRIGNIRPMLDSILSQSRRPDTIVIQLFADEFPHRLDDLPKDVHELVDQGKVSIRFCEENLRPHLKYFYAIQDHPDALVITVDDDIVYQRDVFERLWWSYLQFPKAVSAIRAHLITFSEDGDFLPYNSWLKEIEIAPCKPSMQLFATGVGGVAYPPGTLPAETFDVEDVLSTTVMNDDLWLKAMEVCNGTPVVTPCTNTDLNYVPKTQDVGLFHSNVNMCANDEQLAAICRLIDSRHGEGFLRKQTLSNDGELRLDATLADYAAFTERQYEWVRVRLTRDRNRARKDSAELNGRVASLQRELDELRSSKSYRLGNAIAAPYRALKGLLHR